MRLTVVAICYLRCGAALDWRWLCAVLLPFFFSDVVLSGWRARGEAVLERLVGAPKVFFSVVEEISGVSGLLTTGAQDFAQLGAG